MSDLAWIWVIFGLVGIGAEAFFRHTKEICTLWTRPIRWLGASLIVLSLALRLIPSGWVSLFELLDFIILCFFILIYTLLTYEAALHGFKEMMSRAGQEIYEFYRFIKNICQP